MCNPVKVITKFNFTALFKLSDDTDGSVTKEYSGLVGISCPLCVSKAAVENSGNWSRAV